MQTKTNNAVLAVIGLDQPGIIDCVSSVLTEHGCNTEEMTQTLLHGQFAGIYLVNKPQELAIDELQKSIEAAVLKKKFHVTIVLRPYEENSIPSKPADPFVVSVFGPDRNDIVRTFAHIFGAQKINIEALRAFPIGNGSSVQVFEVRIPEDIDTRSLHRVLLERAKAMGLTLTMQHRDIFEAVHRVEID